jgi:hypothetical protein
LKQLCTPHQPKAPLANMLPTMQEQALIRRREQAVKLADTFMDKSSGDRYKIMALLSELGVHEHPIFDDEPDPSKLEKVPSSSNRTEFCPLLYLAQHNMIFCASVMYC